MTIITSISRHGKSYRVGRDANLVLKLIRQHKFELIKRYNQDTKQRGGVAGLFNEKKLVRE